MATQTLDEMVRGSLDLLPPAGQKVDFDEYKSQLYAAYPDNGRDVFAHLIKREIVNKNLERNAEGKLVVMISRKA